MNCPARFPLLASLTVVSALAAGCQRSGEVAKEGPSVPGAGQPGEAAAAEVEGVPVKTAEVGTWTALTGTLTAEQRTQLTAGAAGKVVATKVERGQLVSAGEVLVVLDVRQARHGALEAQANLRNIKAQRATSAADCRRYEALWKKQAISEQEHERMMAQCGELDAQFDAAEARAAEAARTLSDGQVRAPYAGIVSERPVQVGDYVQPSSPVLTLVKREPLRLRCAVPESQASFVQMGRRLSFEVAAYPGEAFAGDIRFVSGEVREASRDIVFEATVEDSRGRLLPGMFAHGRLYGPSRPLPVVPKGAISKEGERAYVFQIVDGRLQKHVVRLGEVSGDGVAIEEGLAAGDVIVGKTRGGLIDGQPVKAGN